MARRPAKPTRSARPAPVPDGPAGHILQTFSAKSYESIARLTLMVWRVARSDPEMSLEAAFHAQRRDQQALNNLLNERLGLRHRKERRDGDVVKLAAGARSYFDMHPSARANYAHQLKRAARIAAGLIDLRVANVSFAGGSLTISGGRTKDIFGADSVGLGERATNSQRAPVSFADIEALAREKRGQPAPRKSSARGLAAQRLSAGTIEDDLVRLRGRVLQLQSPTNAQRRALTLLQNAIAKVLA